MNCTAIMECILEEHNGFVFGKQYFIDDETLYRIEEDKGIEVLYLGDLTRMDIRMSQELIIFWEDDEFSVVLK